MWEHTTKNIVPGYTQLDPHTPRGWIVCRSRIALIRGLLYVDNISSMCCYMVYCLKYIFCYFWSMSSTWGSFFTARYIFSCFIDFFCICAKYCFLIESCFEFLLVLRFFLYLRKNQMPNLFSIPRKRKTLEGMQSYMRMSFQYQGRDLLISDDYW